MNGKHTYQIIIQGTVNLTPRDFKTKGVHV